MKFFQNPNSLRLLAAAFVVLSSASVMADECTSMAPYLRDIRESASAAENNQTASMFYNAMLMDLMQRAEAENSEGSIEALGYGSGSVESGKSKNELYYHLANSQSASASASKSSQYLRDYANTIASSATTLMGQCFNRRGLDYRFVIGADGKTFFIHATYRTPSNDLPTVNVRQVQHGENVKCYAEEFRTIDAGTQTLKCVRQNSGGDTIIVTTNYGGDEAATFSVPDTRLRYLEKKLALDLTWCGAPGCAADASRQLAWSPKSTLEKLQPNSKLSCNLFDLRALGLIRAGDVLIREQQFPLQLISTQQGDWGRIHQNVTESVPISNRTVKLCGTREEPYEDWPNLNFQVRTQVRYLERVIY